MLPATPSGGEPSAQADLDGFKSVYSIFVSRVDIYTEKAVPELSPAAQGMVGILNAKRIWTENQAFWAQRPTTLHQEIVFASTGMKKPNEMPWKYVEAFAGSDIETNPPATNDAVAKSMLVFTRRVDEFPPKEVIEEIDRLVDLGRLEATLMAEGIVKFARPQKSLWHGLPRSVWPLPGRPNSWYHRGSGFNRVRVPADTLALIT